MKFYCLYIRSFALLCMSALAAHAIPLASAKVIAIEGIASYGAAGVENKPLEEESILFEGDSIVTGKNGVVHLIFSNGVGLTVEKSTNLIFSKLEQGLFWKDDPKEYPEEEISKSTTILELKYGNIKGHAKGLLEESEFRIQTKLGDALISENLFFVEIYYDYFRNDFILNVQNIDGKMELVTKFSGPVRFGPNGMAVKPHEVNATALQVVSIPPKQTFSVRKSRFNSRLRSYLREFPRDAKSRLVLNLEAIEPYLTDQEISIVSPNGTEGVESVEDTSDTGSLTLVDTSGTTGTGGSISIGTSSGVVLAE